MTLNPISRLRASLVPLARILGLVGALCLVACGSPGPTVGVGASSGDTGTSADPTAATFFTGTPTWGTSAADCTPSLSSTGGAADGPLCLGDTGTGTTTGAEPDTAVPLVVITHPVPGLILHFAGAVKLTYTVQDDSCIVSATLLIDGGMPRDLVVPPYEADLEDLPWGTHEIAVQVADAAGNTATSDPVVVRVCSGPDNPV